MTSAARVLRLDHGTWYWLDTEASWTGSMAIMFGAYVMLAFNRFGWPDFAFAATGRWLVLGVAGWLWLTLAPWLLVRIALDTAAPIHSLSRLVGHAHLPLLLLAGFLQVVTVSFNVTDVAVAPALFVAAFWMPAMLVRSVAVGLEVRPRTAVVLAGAPYVIWAMVVGRHLWTQLAHLL